MGLQRLIGYLWVGAMIVLYGIVMWQVFPMLASNQNLSRTALMRLELAVFLKPWNLLTWMVLIAYGIASSWNVRSNWRQDRGAIYVFLMCSFSVVWFVVVLLVVRFSR